MVLLVTGDVQDVLYKKMKICDGDKTFLTSWCPLSMVVLLRVWDIDPCRNYAPNSGSDYPMGFH